MNKQWLSGLCLILAACMLPILPACAQDTLEAPELPLAPFADIRAYPINGTPRVYAKGDFNPEDIPTFTFNGYTMLEGSEAEAAAVMEQGHNPGLGVRSLHDRGITGEGVCVAIIDQHLLVDNPEFQGKVVAYYDTGSGVRAGEGSMHGPAVTSLLVGESMGTAPGALVHYAVAPSWKADSQYFADALYWLIDQNEALPEGDKIRVVSISAAPSGEGSPFEKNHQAYDEAVLAAQAVGMLVLDCNSDNLATGRVWPGYYDFDNPEDPALFTLGYPFMPRDGVVAPAHVVLAPASRRTLVEQYSTNYPSFQYDGSGGLSWAVPYVAGVLAMGWQVRPDLDGDAMMALLLETAHVDSTGAHIIHPVAFIEALEAR